MGKHTGLHSHGGKENKALKPGGAKVENNKEYILVCSAGSRCTVNVRWLQEGSPVVSIFGCLLKTDSQSSKEHQCSVSPEVAELGMMEGLEGLWADRQQRYRVA